MKNVPFLTGLIAVLCAAVCWLDSGNKQAPPVVDHIITAIEALPQAEQAYTRGSKATFMRTTMVLVVCSVLLIILSLKWFNTKLAKKKLAERQLKARMAQQIAQEALKWSHEDVVDPIRKAEDYDTASELLKNVDTQARKLVIACLQYEEKYPDYLVNSENIFYLKNGHSRHVEKVRQAMQQAGEAFNKNMSVHIFFLAGWCRQHIPASTLNQMDKHILEIIYNYIAELKLSLITSPAYTLPYPDTDDFEGDFSKYRRQ